jgi:hypothetical protein
MNETTNHERWKFSSDSVPIESSMIRAARYDNRQHVLEIIFRNGRPYHFVHVPPEEFENLMNAKSKGRYFLQNIRNTYPYWRFHRPVRRKTQEE